MTRLWQTMTAIAVLVVPAAASGATRYAAVGGTGAEPCAQAAPCSLQDAVAGASAADTVNVGPGVYALSATLDVNQDGVVLQGTPGSPKPQFTYAGPAGNAVRALFASNVVVRDIKVEGTTSDFTGLVRVGEGGVVDRIEVHVHGTGVGLLAGTDAVVRDSVIIADGTDPAARVHGTVTGSTILAPNGNVAALSTSTSFFMPAANLTVRNSILRSGPTGPDVIAEDQHNGTMPEPTALLDIDYSSFALATASGMQGVFVPGTHNVGPALLVNVAAGDVHQQAGSPTINAGSAAVPMFGTLDFERDPRTVGIAPDIGADESTTAPTAVTGVVSAVTTTTATLGGTVDPGGLATTYRVEYGPTAAYGSVTPDAVLPAAGSAQPVSVAMSGLPDGTTLHARLVAVNARGTSQGTDVMFNTAADPTPAVTLLRLSPATIRTGAKSSVRFRLSERARITVVVDRLVPGRRKGKVCRPALTTGPRCTKVVRRGAIVATRTAASTVTIGIPKRLGGKVLAPGRYRVSVIAKDFVTGRSSVRRSVILTVRA